MQNPFLLLEKRFFLALRKRRAFRCNLFVRSSQKGFTLQSLTRKRYAIETATPLDCWTVGLLDFKTVTSKSEASLKLKAFP
jgi:hypothetical protein